MAFWGAQVKSGKPFTLKANEPTNVFKRLHISQATLGFGNATMRSILQCNVGNKSPLFLCVLSPDKTETCQLNIEFEESEDVIFSVIGPQSIHITGYFLASSGFRLNDDQSESYGEDVGVSDMEKDSSDDYDFSDSFINDDDDDDKSLKELLASKSKDKKRKGKSRRLRKKMISDSESEETSPIVLDDSSSGDSDCEILSSQNTLPSRVTRSKARDLTLENDDEPNVECKKTTKATTSFKTEENVDAEVSPVEKTMESEILSKKKKRNKEKSNGLEDDVPESIEKEKTTNDKYVYGISKSVSRSCIIKSWANCKYLLNRFMILLSILCCLLGWFCINPLLESPYILLNMLLYYVIDRVIEVSSEVLPSQNATSSKKKRKRDKRGETTNMKLISVMNKNSEAEGDNKKPQESETLASEVIIKEVQKGKIEGKQAINGKKVSILFLHIIYKLVIQFDGFLFQVSILYTGKLKDTEKVFESNLGEAPLRFRLGGDKVIKGLSIGVEGMRVGDKRRLIIPPALGYSKEGLKEVVPKNAWLVYEVEAVKVR
ncbi:unnamed protein product [Cochlearia groenlandica]